MGGVLDTEICPICGEEYWYEFDTRTCEYRKITSCKCDRFREYLEEFLRRKGLWDEFLKFVEKQEKDRGLVRCKECGELYYPDELDENGLCYVCSDPDL